MDTNVYEVILPLLRSAIWGEEKFPFTCEADIDWNEVNKELRAQAIHYLPTNILSRVDSEHCIQYYQNASVALRSWNNIMQEQQNLYALMQKENIPFVILKGAAVDYYYPTPIYRCMGDIDFIVKPEDFDKAAECMSIHGYQLVNDTDDRHLEYKKHGVLFELHQHFSFLKDIETETLQDDLIFKAIDKANIESISNYTFPMLPTLENGLVLLTHINQHMENGLGLRQIIDWMLYIDKEMTDEYWHTTFEPITEITGLKTLAITTTKMCQMYLGLTKDFTFCQDADTNLCEDLMQYIIDQGNFGMKRGSQHNVATNMLATSSMRCLFHTLQRRGLKNWNAAKKHPFLKPSAWIYQITRYIRLGFMRDEPLKQLKTDFLQSKTQENILNQLQVTRRTHKK